MKNVMLSLMLCVTTTQAELLTPYLGPSSRWASYGDWSGSDVGIGLRSTGICVTGDAGMESHFSPLWDGVATVAANASASTSPGAIFMEAHAFADALIYRHDDSCYGLAPYGFLKQGSATLTPNILVDTPCQWVGPV